VRALERPQQPDGNVLLRSLPDEARERISGRILKKPVNSGEVLYESRSPLLYLIFPIAGVISLQATLQDGRTVEEASIGPEGVLGIEYFLGERETSYRAIVTIAGEACWLPVGDFEAILEAFPALQEVLQNGIRRTINRLRNRVICASVHSASQRMATWLLRAQDRTGVSQFELTQRTLAGLFGLRLATISDTSSRLCAAGAIDQTRGMLTIVKRSELEKQACECYERLREGTGPAS
jgi:CRP-like cAMP-binding protein